MSILWCGGEDVDFPNGGAVSTTTTTTYFRSAYARGSIYGTSANAFSNPFPGGAVTSFWLSYQLGFFPENSNGSYAGSKFSVGLGNSANGSAGIWIFTSGTSGQGLSVVKYDGTTTTSLCGGVNLFTTSISQIRVDLNVQNYGASSTINLWVAGNLYASFTGSSAITGLTNFNRVLLAPSPSGTFGVIGNASEIIVADEDTRSFSLKTMAPAGAGAVTQWTGLFSAINPVTITDSNAVFTNTTAQNSAFTTTGVPAGTFAVRLVKTTVRAAATAGSTATGVNAGFNIASTVYPQTTRSALGTAFTDFEDFSTTNPATSTAWTTTDLSSVQIDLTSS